jgi:uncharacterized protein GlcG (DUF336 family)
MHPRHHSNLDASITERVTTANRLRGTVIALLLTFTTAAASADDGACRGLPNHAALKKALDAAVIGETSGLNNHMWASLVSRDGTVCAVAFSGNEAGAQWLGSRVISVQKANTANTFSLGTGSASNGSGQAKGLALSTANLYSAVQPGGSLYGLQHSNPVDTAAAYGGRSQQFGTHNDPMVGKRVGGINVFGGGVPLYAEGGKLVGGVGVSGDTSCADHNIGWRVRHHLALDYVATVPGPASLFARDAAHPDNIIFDIDRRETDGTGISASGFGHPTCLNTHGSNTLPAVR